MYIPKYIQCVQQGDLDQFSCQSHAEVYILAIFIPNLSPQYMKHNETPKHFHNQNNPCISLLLFKTFKNQYFDVTLMFCSSNTVTFNFQCMIFIINY